MESNRGMRTGSKEPLRSSFPPHFCSRLPSCRWIVPCSRILVNGTRAEIAADPMSSSARAPRASAMLSRCVHSYLICTSPLILYRISHCAISFAFSLQYVSNTSTEGGDHFRYPWSGDSAMVTVSRSNASDTALADCARCWSSGAETTFDPAIWVNPTSILASNATTNFRRMVNPEAITTPPPLLGRSVYKCFDCWIHATINPDALSEGPSKPRMWKNDVTILNMFFFMLSNFVLMLAVYVRYLHLGPSSATIAAEQLVKAHLERQDEQSLQRSDGGQATGEGEDSSDGLGTSECFFVVKARNQLTADTEHAVNGVYEANHRLPCSDGAPQYTLVKREDRSEQRGGGRRENEADDDGADETSRYVIRRVRRLKTQTLMWSHWVIMDVSPEAGMNRSSSAADMERRLRAVDIDSDLADEDVIFAAPVCTVEQQMPPEGNWHVEAHEKDAVEAAEENSDGAPLLEAKAHSVAVLKCNQALFFAERESNRKRDGQRWLWRLRYGVLVAVTIAVAITHAIFLQRMCSTRRADSGLDLPPVPFIFSAMFVRAACQPADRFVGWWMLLCGLVLECFTCLASYDGLLTSPFVFTVLRTVFRFFFLSVMDLSMWPIAASLCYLVCIYVAANEIYTKKYAHERSIHSNIRASLSGALPSWMLGGSKTDSRNIDTSMMSENLRAKVSGLVRLKRATLDFVVGGSCCEQLFQRAFNLAGRKLCLIFINVMQLVMCLCVMRYGSRSLVRPVHARQTHFFEFIGIRQWRWAALTIIVGSVIHQSIALHAGLRHFGHTKGEWPVKWVMRRWALRLALPALFYSPLALLIMRSDQVGTLACLYSAYPDDCPNPSDGKNLVPAVIALRTGISVAFAIWPYLLLSCEWWLAEYHANDYKGPLYPFACCFPCPPICRCLYMLNIIGAEGRVCGDFCRAQLEEEEESNRGTRRRRRNVCAKLKNDCARTRRYAKKVLSEFFLTASNMLATIHFLLFFAFLGIAVAALGSPPWAIWAGGPTLEPGDTVFLIAAMLLLFAYLTVGAVMHGLVAIKKIRNAAEFDTPSSIFFALHIVLMRIIGSRPALDAMGLSAFAGYLKPVRRQLNAVAALGLPGGGSNVTSSSGGNRELIARIKAASYPYGYPHENEAVASYAIVMVVNTALIGLTFGFTMITLVRLLRDDNWIIPDGDGIFTTKRLKCCRLNRRRIVQYSYILIIAPLSVTFGQVAGTETLTSTVIYLLNWGKLAGCGVCIMVAWSLWLCLDRRGGRGGAVSGVKGRLEKARSAAPIVIATLICFVLVVSCAICAAILDPLDEPSIIVGVFVIVAWALSCMNLYLPIRKLAEDSADSNIEVWLVDGFAFAFDKLTGELRDDTLALQNIWKLTIISIALGNIMLLFPAIHAFGVTFQKAYNYITMIMLIGVPSIVTFAILHFTSTSQRDFKQAFDQLKIQDPSKFGSIIQTVAEKLRAAGEGGRQTRAQTQADRVRKVAGLWGISESFYTRLDATFGYAAATFRPGDRVLIDAAESRTPSRRDGVVTGVHDDDPTTGVRTYDVSLVYGGEQRFTAAVVNESSVPASRLHRRAEGAESGCQIVVRGADDDHNVLYNIIAEMSSVWADLLLPQSTSWRSAAFERANGQSFASAIDDHYRQACAKSHGCSANAPREAVNISIDRSAPTFTPSTAEWESRISGVYVTIPYSVSACVWTASDGEQTEIAVEMNDAPIRILQRFIANCPTHPKDLIGCAVLYRSEAGTWIIGPPTDLVRTAELRQPWLCTTGADEGAHSPVGLTWELLSPKKRRLYSRRRRVLSGTEATRQPTPFEATLCDSSTIAAPSEKLAMWDDTAGGGCTMTIRLRLPSPSPRRRSNCFVITIVDESLGFTALSGRYQATARIENGAMTYVHDGINAKTPFVSDPLTPAPIERIWLTRGKDLTTWMIGPANDVLNEDDGDAPALSSRASGCCCSTRREMSGERVWLRTTRNLLHEKFGSLDTPEGCSWEVMSPPHLPRTFAATDLRVEYDDAPAASADSGSRSAGAEGSGGDHQQPLSVEDAETEWLSFRATGLSMDTEKSSRRRGTTSDCYMQLFFNEMQMNMRLADDFGLPSVVGGTRTELIRDSLSPAWATPLPVPRGWSADTPLTFFVGASGSAGTNEEVGVCRVSLAAIQTAGVAGLTVTLYASSDLVVVSGNVGRRDRRACGQLHIIAHGTKRPLKKQLLSALKCGPHFKLRFDVLVAIAARLDADLKQALIDGAEWAPEASEVKKTNDESMMRHFQQTSAGCAAAVASSRTVGGESAGGTVGYVVVHASLGKRAKMLASSPLTKLRHGVVDALSERESAMRASSLSSGLAPAPFPGSSGEDNVAGSTASIPLFVPSSVARMRLNPITTSRTGLAASADSGSSARALSIHSSSINDAEIPEPLSAENAKKARAASRSCSVHKWWCSRSKMKNVFGRIIRKHKEELQSLHSELAIEKDDGAIDVVRDIRASAVGGSWTYDDLVSMGGGTSAGQGTCLRVFCVRRLLDVLSCTSTTTTANAMDYGEEEQSSYIIGGTGYAAKGASCCDFAMLRNSLIVDSLKVLSFGNVCSWCCTRRLLHSSAFDEVESLLDLRSAWAGVYAPSRAWEDKDTKGTNRYMKVPVADGYALVRLCCNKWAIEKEGLRLFISEDQPQDKVHPPTKGWTSCAQPSAGEVELTVRPTSEVLWNLGAAPLLASAVMTWQETLCVVATEDAEIAAQFQVMSIVAVRRQQEIDTQLILSLARNVENEVAKMHNAKPRLLGEFSPFDLQVWLRKNEALARELGSKMCHKLFQQRERVASRASAERAIADARASLIGHAPMCNFDPRTYPALHAKELAFAEDESLSEDERDVFFIDLVREALALFNAQRLLETGGANEAGAGADDGPSFVHPAFTDEQLDVMKRTFYWDSCSPDAADALALASKQTRQRLESFTVVPSPLIKFEKGETAEVIRDRVLFNDELGDRVRSNPLTVGGAESDDVKQGLLSDCWLLSAFSVLADGGHRALIGEHTAIEDIFTLATSTASSSSRGVERRRSLEFQPHSLGGAANEVQLTDLRAQEAAAGIRSATETSNDRRSGTYIVKLYRSDLGRWERVLIDDYFPVRDGDWTPLFACSTEAEMWVMALEKAYAKWCLRGRPSREAPLGYSVLNGGQIADALVALTGGAAEEIDLTLLSGMELNELWGRLVRYKEAGFLMGGASPSGIDSASEAVDGIVQGHAYSLLDLRTSTDFSSGAAVQQRMLKIRNPWGVNVVVDSSVALPWSPYSDLWQGPGAECVDFLCFSSLSISISSPPHHCSPPFFLSFLLSLFTVDS